MWWGRTNSQVQQQQQQPGGRDDDSSPTTTTTSPAAAAVAGSGDEARRRDEYAGSETDDGPSDSRQRQEEEGRPSRREQDGEGRNSGGVAFDDTEADASASVQDRPDRQQQQARHGEDGIDHPPPPPSTTTASRTIPRRPAVRSESASGASNRYDVTYRPGKLLLYSPPRQRQKWGQEQILPRVNWGDLFFDLFYVASTYNVSMILVDEPTGVGLLFSAATFWPTMSLWVEKSFYDARFAYEDDLFHRAFQIVILSLLATAVLHTRTASVMSDTAHDVSMFAFALAVVLERLFSVLRFVEVYARGVGQVAQVKATALNRLRMIAVPTAVYAAAMVVAGIDYYGSQRRESGSSAGSYYRGNETSGQASDYGGDGDVGSSGANRLLAGSSSSSGGYDGEFTPNFIPIWLCFAGFLCDVTIQAIAVVCCFPAGGRHKEM